MTAMLLKIPEVSAMLSVSRSTVYELIRSGALPVRRLGRSVRIPASAVARLVAEDAGTVGPPSRLAVAAE